MAGKERPILFSGEMVRAILDGRKTQTRRIAKLDLSPWLDGQADKIDESEMVFQFSEGHSGFGLYVSCADYPEEGSDFYRCPYGKPGDRLWVRETFTPPASRGPKSSKTVENCHYKADGWWNIDGTPIKWKPSIHMPRWASRITLEIKSVKVERLQDISEEDALAEGVSFDSGWEESLGEGYTSGSGYLNYQSEDDAYEFGTAKESFRSLWNKINGADSWNQNPWVWVIEFKKVEE